MFQLAAERAEIRHIQIARPVALCLMINHFGEGKRMKKRDYGGVLYDPNVDYDSLEQHTYKDSGDYVFYTCPLCGHEYLATFITSEEGQTMCVDCWKERYGD